MMGELTKESGLSNLFEAWQAGVGLVVGFTKIRIQNTRSVFRDALRPETERAYEALLEKFSRGEPLPFDTKNGQKLLNSELGIEYLGSANFCQFQESMNQPTIDRPYDYMETYVYQTAMLRAIHEKHEPFAYFCRRDVNGYRSLHEAMEQLVITDLAWQGRRAPSRYSFTP
jgi:hypothetical protein